MNSDFKDLLSKFNEQGVEYIVVGAHALAAYGHVRATKDMAVWVRPEANNSQRVLKALKSFGAPLHDLTADELSKPGLIFQIGVPPLRIDIITEIDGVTFSQAWPERLNSKFEGIPVPILSKKHLIQNKKTSGRRQDLADIEFLEGN